MFAPPSPSLPRALPAEHRERLMATAREVSFPPGTRLFEEGARADRFWVIRTGTASREPATAGSTRMPASFRAIRANALSTRGRYSSMR